MKIEPTKNYNKKLEAYVRKYNKSKREKIRDEVWDIIAKIANNKLTQKEKHDIKLHQLTSDKLGIYEFHYKFDLCVEYIVVDNTLYLIDIGTHSQLSLSSVQNFQNIEILSTIRSLTFSYPN